MQHPEPPPSPTPLRAANRLASFGHALRGIALLVASQTNALAHALQVEPDERFKA